MIIFPRSSQFGLLPFQKWRRRGRFELIASANLKGLEQRQSGNGWRDYCFALGVSSVCRGATRNRRSLSAAGCVRSGRSSGQYMRGPTSMRIIMRAALIAALSSLPQVASAFDNGQYNDVPDNVRSWFKSVRSPHGVPCCDIADGHRTDYDIRPDGYWIPIAGEMRHVPPEAIVYNAGNPVGEAVVWYVRQGANNYYIRCFVPGGGV
jgi:hypothetical protein